MRCRCYGQRQRRRYLPVTLLIAWSLRLRNNTAGPGLSKVGTAPAPPIIRICGFIAPRKKKCRATRESLAAWSLHVRAQGANGDQESTRVVEYLLQKKKFLSKKIQDYQKLKSEIEEAIDLARQCHGCSLRPDHQTCLACDVLAGNDRLPLPIQAIL
jgi:hypothetical protein